MSDPRIPGTNWHSHVDIHGPAHDAPQPHSKTSGLKTRLHEASHVLHGLKARLDGHIAANLPPRSGLLNKLNGKLHQYANQFMFEMGVPSAYHLPHAPYQPPCHPPHPVRPAFQAPTPMPQDVPPSMKRDVRAAIVQVLGLENRNVREALLGQTLSQETPENMLRHWPAGQALTILHQQREMLSARMVDVERQCIKAFQAKGYTVDGIQYQTLRASLEKAHKEALGVLKDLEDVVQRKLVSDTLGLKGAAPKLALLDGRLARETPESFLQTHGGEGALRFISAEMNSLAARVHARRAHCQHMLHQQGLDPRLHASQIEQELSLAYGGAHAHLSQLQAAAAKACIDQMAATPGGDLHAFLLGPELLGETGASLLQRLPREMALQFIDQQQAMLGMKAIQLAANWQSALSRHGVPVEAYAMHLHARLVPSIVKAQVFLAQLRQGVEAAHSGNEYLATFMNVEDRQADIQQRRTVQGYAGTRQHLDQLQASFPQKFNAARLELKQALDSGAIDRTVFDRKIKLLNDAHAQCQAVIDRHNAELDTTSKQAVVNILKAEGVTMDSSPAALRRAYMVAIRRNHPDKSAQAPDNAAKEEFSKSLISAWDDYEARVGGPKRG